MKITEKSDVYSYGVVVLEVLTGKQPIDPTVPEGLHLVDWVRQNRGSLEVLDSTLRSRTEAEADEMMQVLGTALLCVNSSPDERPTMKDVAAMLKEIKQEREEYSKVDLLLKKSPPPTTTMQEESRKNEMTMIPAAAASSSKEMRREERLVKSNNTSFSASSLLYSSSSSIE